MNIPNIKFQLINQDNCCTQHPMFCVQVCNRIGPIIPEYANSDNLMIHSHSECHTYYPEDTETYPKLQKLYHDGELSDEYVVGGYIEQWKTVATCFTREGCQQHLNQNEHNYRNYFGTRIYVESFYRNPEMIAIRDHIINSNESDKIK